MISKEMIKKIKTIEIKSDRVVKEVLSGQYHSVFIGNGMEFEDIREYYEGDDVRNIDWNVTARSERAYIKKFREERELNIFLMIDMSGSENFGNKREKIAEIGATLALSAVKNNDKAGMFLFTDRVERVVPSKKGRKHAMAIIEQILTFTPENKGTNIENALVHFNNFERKKSVLFLISDFMDEGYEKILKVVSMKHDVVLIRICEEAEKKLPAGAIYVLKDMETGEEIIVDASSEEKVLRGVNIKMKNMITINTNEDFIKPLMYYFKRRMRK